MALTASDIQDRFFSEIGEDLGELARDHEVLGWFNDGLGRLPARHPKTATITWSASDESVPLPTDLVSLEAVRTADGVYVPKFLRWGSTLQFLDPATVGGSATIFYFARFPRVDGDNPSLCSPVGEDAAFSYARYRFFRKLAGSRADFRRYSTITGQSGIDVSDLEAIAERHRQDFVDSRAEMEEGELLEPATPYGD